MIHKNGCISLGDFAPDDVEVKVREHILQDFENFLRFQVPGNASWCNCLKPKYLKLVTLNLKPLCIMQNNGIHNVCCNAFISFNK